MIDLNQVSLALRNASTPRSLLILDEFGKGTLATGQHMIHFGVFDSLTNWVLLRLCPNRLYYLTDGAGLFTGIIKYLLSLGESCPLVFAATHFHEVLNTEILSPNLPISFVHMAVRIINDKGDDLEARDQLRGDASQSETEGHHLVRPGEVVTYLFK